jgi:hypothetical protein
VKDISAAVTSLGQVKYKNYKFKPGHGT